MRAQLRGDQQANIGLTLAYDTTLEGWSRALDLRDKETEGHTQRVAELTIKLAQVLGLNDEDLIHIRRGALLHDIGKLGVPDQILLKDCSLDEIDQETMKHHPLHASNLLFPISYLRPALDIPYRLTYAVREKKPKIGVRSPAGARPLFGGSLLNFVKY